ncbi:hypothetical protein K1719_032398 [Acacia pycnantha]|nr:hypothetical protein K1719_032398 [Acacia pycnantha]
MVALFRFHYVCPHIPRSDWVRLLSSGSVFVDLVTHSDKACEDLIFNHLKKLYPTHKVLQNLLITHMDS